MKVFVVASRKTEESKKRGMFVANVLESLGHEVNRSMVGRDYTSKEHDVAGTVKADLESIKNCDVMVYDVTVNTTGGGYLIGVALQQGKNVLCLHDKESSIRPSVRLRGVESPYMTFVEYTKDNLRHILEEYLEELKKNIANSRYILTIEPDIDRFLSWGAQEWGINKAEVLRRSIRHTIEDDGEYQAFMKKKYQ